MLEFLQRKIGGQSVRHALEVQLDLTLLADVERLHRELRGEVLQDWSHALIGDDDQRAAVVTPDAPTAIRSVSDRPSPGPFGTLRLPKLTRSCEADEDRPGRCLRANARMRHSGVERGDGVRGGAAICSRSRAWTVVHAVGPHVAMKVMATAPFGIPTGRYCRRPRHQVDAKLETNGRLPTG
jgi:hypothetical protein